MELFTALTRTTPTLAGVAFDATIESTFTASMETTGYPMESGVNVADHSLILPLEYRMTIVASNNPLQPGITDFIGGAVSNLVPDYLAGIAGLASGLLSSSAETHASVVLQSLVTAMVARRPVQIDGGDIVLNEMVITDITRTRTAENENGLECDITLRELPRIALIESYNFGSVNVPSSDPASTRVGRIVNGGFAKIADAGEKVRNSAKNVFDRAASALPGDSAGATVSAAGGFS